MKKTLILCISLPLLLISCNTVTVFQNNFEDETINELVGDKPPGEPADDKIKLITGSGIVKADPTNNQNRMLSIAGSNIEFLTGGFPHENKKYLILFTMIADIEENDAILINLNSQNSNIASFLQITHDEILDLGSESIWTHTPGKKFSVIIALDAELKTYSIAIGNNSASPVVSDQPFLSDTFDELKGIKLIATSSTSNKTCLIDDVTILKNKTMDDSDAVD